MSSENKSKILKAYEYFNLKKVFKENPRDIEINLKKVDKQKKRACSWFVSEEKIRVEAKDFNEESAVNLVVGTMANYKLREHDNFLIRNTFVISFGITLHILVTLILLFSFLFTLGFLPMVITGILSIFTISYLTVKVKKYSQKSKQLITTYLKESNLIENDHEIDNLFKTIELKRVDSKFPLILTISFSMLIVLILILAFRF